MDMHAAAEPLAKLTPHRRTVLNLVRSGKDHPTARELFERAGSSSSRFSFATVYNALKYLTGQGLLRTIRTGDDAVRYDPVLERHDHLICRVCGRLEDLRRKRKSVPSPSAAPSVPGNFLIEEVSIQYLGICGDCRKAGTASARNARRRSGK